MKYKAPLMVAAIACGLAATACQKAVDAVTAKYAWARLSPVPGRPSALYFTLTGADRADRLVAIDSAVVQRIELHESMSGGTHGMASMRPLAGVDVPANGSALFQPGGNHAMLFGLDPAITPGTAIPLRFHFASGHVAAAEAKTVAVGDDAPGA